MEAPGLLLSAVLGKTDAHHGCTDAIWHGRSADGPGNMLCMEGDTGHRSEGHECPPYVLDEDECEMLSASVPYEELSYHDPEDADFWVPHQKEPRMVKFNRLTSTIDEIVTQCGYHESERERLAEQHRRTAQAFLDAYQGPVDGPIPLHSSPGLSR